MPRAGDLARYGHHRPDQRGYRKVMQAACERRPRPHTMAWRQETNEASAGTTAGREAILMDVACFCGCRFSCAGTSVVSGLRRVREPRRVSDAEEQMHALDLLLTLVRCKGVRRPAGRARA